MQTQAHGWKNRSSQGTLQVCGLLIYIDFFLFLMVYLHRVWKVSANDEVNTIVHAQNVICRPH